MRDFTLPLLIVAVVTLWSVWREYGGDNRRDAKWLAAFRGRPSPAGGRGSGGVFGSASSVLKAASSARNCFAEAS